MRSNNKHVKNSLEITTARQPQENRTQPVSFGIFCLTCENGCYIPNLQMTALHFFSDFGYDLLGYLLEQSSFIGGCLFSKQLMLDQCYVSLA